MSGSSAPKQNLEESAALPMRSQSVGPGSVVRRDGELANVNRKKHNGGVVKEFEPESPKSRVMVMHHRARCECQLDFYRLHSKIEPEEFEAGMRFRQAYLFKAEGIKTKDSSLGSYGAGDQSSIMEKLNSAERTLKQAYQELSHMQALIVVSVCGADEGCGTSARLKTLRRGLERLARLWHLI